MADEKKISYGNPDKEARAKTAAGSDAKESQILYEYLIMAGAAYVDGKIIPYFLNEKGADRIEKIKEVVAKIFSEKETKAEKKARIKAEKEEAKAKKKAEAEAKKIADKK